MCAVHRLVVIAEILEKTGISRVSKVKGIRLDWGDGSISKCLSFKNEDPSSSPRNHVSVRAKCGGVNM